MSVRMCVHVHVLVCVYARARVYIYIYACTYIAKDEIGREALVYVIHCMYKCAVYIGRCIVSACKLVYANALEVTHRRNLPGASFSSSGPNLLRKVCASENKRQDEHQTETNGSSVCAFSCLSDGLAVCMRSM